VLGKTAKGRLEGLPLRGAQPFEALERRIKQLLAEQGIDSPTIAAPTPQ
jgi:hypothetical protein